MVLREAASPRNYASLWRMARRAPQFGETARRYFLGGGAYPWRCPVRTPLGIIAPELHSHHDVWTVNEVFFREDYRVDGRIRTAVDVGSNIGISGLYFLTRNSDARCFLFEPDARNVERLVRNIAPYADRAVIEQVAVLPEAQSRRIAFAADPTGRYGHVVEAGGTTEVDAVGIDNVLERVLAVVDTIDVLKVDTEGLEAATIASIRADLLDRIELIYYESREPADRPPANFDQWFASETVRLRRRVG
jgi:FkbM family methyltransferase